MTVEFSPPDEKKGDNDSTQSWKDYTVSNITGKVYAHKDADGQSLEGLTSPDYFGDHPADRVQVLDSGKIITDL